jgi:cytochrome oxidase assembly protein ShyY1
MYRFALRPKWILFHLLIVLLVFTMVNLGIWQYHRYQSRTAFNDEVRSRFDLAAQPFDQLVTATTDPDDVEWLQASLTGTYLADEQLILINRGQYGQAGSDVVTPLELADGTLVLIDRGFLVEGSAVPAPPAGEVTVTGTIRTSERRSLGGLTDPPGELREAQRLDIERLAPQMPGPVAPVFVTLVTSEPAQTGGLQPLPAPELSDGPHLSYMVQWFIFSVCAIVGWVLALRRSAKKRLSEAAERTAADSPSPADDEPATAPS